MNEKSVWTAHISARKARDVARALKAAGYGSATRENCRGFVNNVARSFEPGDIASQNKVRRLICEAAGIQPRRDK